MRELSPTGHEAAADLARQHGVSSEAVVALLGALAAGDGKQAQFDHPDLGGMGQWSRGGMLMIGEMFNDALKAKVAKLCEDAAALLDSKPDLLASPDDGKDSTRSRHLGAGRDGRWPAGLGEPASAGSQNDMHYAVFPDQQRLAIDDGGKVTVYDTGEHHISGFSQQQGSDRSMKFTSQHGDIRLDELKVVSAGEPESTDQKPAKAEAAEADADKTADGSDPAAPTPAPAPTPTAQPAAADDSHEAIFAKIEGLAALHSKGVLSQEELDRKKAELLDRL